MGMTYVFCDESRQDLLASKKSISDCNRYTCIGGIMIPANKLDDIKSNITSLRERYNVRGELKWGTVAANRIDFYREIIDYFFNEQALSFRTIVIDASKINNEMFNQSDQELGYYKFFYELLHYWVDCDLRYRVYTDQKTNCDATRLRELRRILNTSLRGEPIASVQAINSKESILLQLENILMGAVGYKYNFGNHGHSEAKRSIVEKIEKNLGRCIMPTSRGEQKFNVFEIALREGR